MVFYTKALNTKLAKRMALTAVLAANGVGAFADNYLEYVVPTLKAGEKATVTVLLKNDDRARSVRSNIVLPEGINIVRNANGDLFTTSADRINSQYIISQDSLAPGNYFVEYGASHNGVEVLGQKGDPIFSFEVAVDPTLAGKDVELKLANQLITIYDGDNTKNFTNGVTVNVQDPNAVTPEVYLSPVDDIYISPDGTELLVNIGLHNNVPTTGIEVKFTLPEGLTTDPTKWAGTERTNGFTVTGRKLVTTDGRTYQLRCFLFGKNNNIRGNEGAVFSFPIVASPELAEESYIEVFDAVVSQIDATQKYQPDPIRIKVINKQASIKKDLDQKLDDLQEKLDSIMGTTPDEVRNDDRYNTFDPIKADSITAQEAIDAFKDAVEQRYNDGQLTDNDTDLDNLYNDADELIEKIIDTIREQKELYDKKVKNDAVYDALTPTGLMEAWNEANDEIGNRSMNDGLDAKFNDVLTEIKGDIVALEQDIEDRHDQILLDDDAQTELAQKIQDIKDRLQNLREKAAAAEQAKADVDAVVEDFDQAYAAVDDVLKTEREVVKAVEDYNNALQALKDKIGQAEAEPVEELVYDYADELAAVREAVDNVTKAAEEAQARLDYEAAVKAVEEAYDEAVAAVDPNNAKVAEKIAYADEAIEALKDKKNEAEAVGGSYKNLDYQAEYDEAMRRIALIKDAEEVSQYDDKAQEAIDDAENNTKVPTEVEADVTAEKQAFDDALQVVKDAIEALDNALGNDDITAEKQAVDDALAALEQAKQELEDAVKAAADNHKDDGDATTDADLQTALDNAVAAAQALPISQELYDQYLKGLVEAAQEAIDAVGDFIADNEGKLTVPANADELDRLFDEARQAIEAINAKVDEIQQILDERDAITAELNSLIDNLDRRIFHCGEDILSEGYYAMDVLSAELDAIKEKVAKLHADIDEAYNNLTLDQTKFQEFKDRVAEINEDIDDWRREMGSKQAIGQNEADQNKAELLEGRNQLEDAKAGLQDELDTLVNNAGLDPDSPEVKAIQDQIDAIEDAIEGIDTEIAKAEVQRKLLDDDTLDEIKDKIADVQDAIDAAEGDFEALQQTVSVPGDADGNGKVDVNDYVTMVDMYLHDTFPTAEGNPLEFQKLDVNGDNKIDLGDITGIVNIILYGNYAGPVNARVVETQNAQLMAEMQMVNGKRRIALNLTGATDFVACKLDLVLPEGMTIADITATDRTKKHSIVDAEIENGVYRIVISSASNKLIAGTEGAMLYIDLEGTGNVEFQNVVFSDSHASTYELPVSSQTTGVANVRVEADSQSTIYSLGGRVMNALKKGINIIRRADGSTQKVIK